MRGFTVIVIAGADLLKQTAVQSTQVAAKCSCWYLARAGRGSTSPCPCHRSRPPSSAKLSRIVVHACT